MAEVVFPPAFATRMQEKMQGEWQDFVLAHQIPSPTSIRINPKKTSARDLEKILWTDFGYYLPERPSFTFDPVFHGGAYYVQEASSMFIEQALKQTVDLSQPLRILDLCAAPGGKSTHLLSLINNQSLLVANETIRTRATILAENICKWGNINAVVTNSDPEDFQGLNGFFDVILVDAPCSGEGLFRKDAAATLEWSEENARLCSLRQQRILNHIWPALRENGILIYCTCTYNQEENLQNLVPFVSGNKATGRKLNIEKYPGITEISSGGVFGYQFYPQKIKGEGFFISVLQKTEQEEALGIHGKRQVDSVSKKMNERLVSWVKDSEEVEFTVHNDLVLALPKHFMNEIDFLSRKVRVIQKGTAVATMKHDKLVPEQAFALSNEISRENFNSIELSHDQAIAYLRKDNLRLETATTGFALVTHQGTALGWVNQLPNRTNNLYPPGWRIRS
ncbi:rRNA cytosine-C5-methyltransferase [Cytophagales bacterium WSM2-2]|nr:rRNA cytosine-C5-methyltransferase [Cytophagales bacterium WSM2-2]